MAPEILCDLFQMTALQQVLGGCWPWAVWGADKKGNRAGQGGHLRVCRILLGNLLLERALLRDRGEEV